MKKLLTTIILLCFSVIANAQLSDSFVNFLKVNDPNLLEYYYSHSDECPWTEPEAKQIIEGVIKRSRIRTAHGLGFGNDLYLNIDANCLRLTNGSGYAVVFNVVDGSFPMLYENPYGGLLASGSNAKSYSLNTFKTMIENAVTDFVEVNFLSDSN